MFLSQKEAEYMYTVASERGVVFTGQYQRIGLLMMVEFKLYDPTVCDVMDNSLTDDTRDE